ncbi:MAG: riboflavin kinase [Oscillospiraceae bacterium]
MNIITDINKKVDFKKPNAIALGFFDGVHIGHKEVILKTFSPNYESAVFTFDEKISRKNYLITFDQKIDLLKNVGVKNVVAPFYKEFKDFNAEKFIELLYKNLFVRKIVCGYNFTFGKNGSFGVDFLRETCKKFNIIFEIVFPVKMDNEIISTTLIKSELSKGNIEKVNKLLGYIYYIDLEVKKGNQLGRTIERPTINQPFNDGQILPKYGAYATLTQTEKGYNYSATNVGIKPTVGSKEPLAETFILDYSGNLYNKKIKVYFFNYIRGEKVFKNLDILKDDILGIANLSKNNGYKII